MQKKRFSFLFTLIFSLAFFCQPFLIHAAVSSSSENLAGSSTTTTKTLTKTAGTSGSGDGSYALNEFNPKSDGSKILSEADFNTTVSNLVNIVLVVASGLTFAYLIYGAIGLITSGGDVSKKNAARQRITTAAIGLLVVASVWAIFNLIITIAFGSADITLPNLKGS